MNLSLFDKLLPAKLKQKLIELNELNYIPSIVGGISRDYLLLNKLGDDFDIEIRIKNNRALDLKDADQIFQDAQSFEELAYGFRKVVYPNFSIEYSLPRIEKFNNSIGHSNFDVKFVEDEYYQTVARRDFTINSIFFEFNESWKVVDPLKGQEHLKLKKLVPASDNFYRDPVRFLRAIRFEILLGFSSEVDFKQLDMSCLPASYLYDEVKKSGNSYLFFKKLNVFRTDKKEIMDFILLVDLDLVDQVKYMPYISIEEKKHALKMLERSVKSVYSWTKKYSVVKEYKLKNDLSYLYKKIDSLPLGCIDVYKKLGLIDISKEEFLKVKAYKDFDTSCPARHIYNEKFGVLF